MKNKFGAYIQRLMSTVLDNEQEQFVKDLALSELTRLKVDMDSFIMKNNNENDDNESTIKQLLQEETIGKKQSSK